MKKKYIFYIVSIFFFKNPDYLFSQDVGFSQFYANKLYLNPAFAGYLESSRVFLGYRNQYPGTANTYVTYFASFDREFKALEGGLGFFLLNDVQAGGIINKASGGAIYSYRMEVNKDFIVRTGFQVSYVQKNLKSSDLIFSDMIDITTGNISPTQETIEKQNKGYIDFALGLLGYSNNYYWGISAHHLTQPNESYNNSYDVPLPIKYTFHIGAEYSLTGRYIGTKDITISPNLLFQQQQEFRQMNYGLYISYLPFTFGTWLRQDLEFNYDSFIILAGYTYNAYNFSYSYDLSIAGVKLNNKNLGTHEVTFSVDLEYNTKRKKIRAIKCPKF